MKSRFGSWVLLAAACLAGAARAGEIDPGLQDILDGAPDDQMFSALVFLTDQVDLQDATRQMDHERATLQRRHQFVVRSLQGVANATQGPLTEALLEGLSNGSVQEFHAFWIRNLFSVTATKAQLLRIAQRADVDIVYFDYEIELIDPAPVAGGPGEGNDQHVESPEIGLVAIRAPEVWALGIDGRGVLVSNTDTGVDANHAALGSRWAPNVDGRFTPQMAWFDPTHQNDNFPYDQNGHGTHTMGTVCGGPPGDQVGAAPGAMWSAAAPIDRISIERTVADVLLSYEWFLDPDGNPDTNFDVPASNSNSWGVTTGHGYPPCDQTFWSSIDACEAAGIVMIYSAGNEGFSGLRRPADRATTPYNCQAVAAVDANNSSWPIAGFSSRGPTRCTPDGREAIKPDIAAPGVNVRSSLPGNRYGQLSGTSMASPHINGVVALMRQANPDTTVNEIKQVIYETAHDLGNPGEDNDYGWGMVDAYEAVTRVMNSNDPFACCFVDGSCSELLPQDCRAQGGKPSFGRGCDEVSCPQPGACCLDDGSCMDIPEADCTFPGASWSSGDCASTQCAPPGACCFDDGTCQEIGPLACENADGEFSGHGTTCADADCPQPGACCITDDSCEVLGPKACRAAGGDFNGHGTSCLNACPCDKLRRIKATCSDTGFVKVIVRFIDNSFNGDRVTIEVGGRSFVTGVIDNKAKLIVGPFSGSQLVRLLSPACDDTATATCP